MLKVLRRAAVLSTFAVTAVSAFAVLGDGKTKQAKSRTLLSGQVISVTPGNFSLKSGYNFRGNQVINSTQEKKFVTVNTTMTYQKGNTTYIVPLKKKIYINTTNSGFTITH